MIKYQWESPCVAVRESPKGEERRGEARDDGCPCGEVAELGAVPEKKIDEDGSEECDGDNEQANPEDHAEISSLLITIQAMAFSE